MNQIDESFCAAEHAARSGRGGNWARLVTDLMYHAAKESCKAKRAARIGLAVQIINMAMLAALIYFRTRGI